MNNSIGDTSKVTIGHKLYQLGSLPAGQLAIGLGLIALVALLFLLTNIVG